MSNGKTGAKQWIHWWHDFWVNYPEVPNFILVMGMFKSLTPSMNNSNTNVALSQLSFKMTRRQINT